jgi:hypothetical protein
MKSRKRVQRPSCMVITSGRGVVGVVDVGVAAMAGVVDEVEMPVTCSAEVSWAGVTKPDCRVTLLSAGVMDGMETPVACRSET